MKKSIFWRIALVLLPMLTVGLEGMPDSVTAVVNGATQTCSFFSTLADGVMPVGLGFAGFVTIVTVVLAVISVISKKKYWLNCVMGAALLAAILSVAPLLLGTDPLVIPNVGVTILLCLEALLAFIIKKNENAPTAGTGKRLG